MLEYLNNVFLLGRNGCFSGVGVLIASLKSENFQLLLHLGNRFYCNCTFKTCSAIINGENHVKSHQKSCFCYLV